MAAGLVSEVLEAGTLSCASRLAWLWKIHQWSQTYQLQHSAGDVSSSLHVHLQLVWPAA